MPIWRTLKFGHPNSSKVEKEKIFANRLKLRAITLFNNLNNESEHIEAANRTKN